MDFDIFSKGFDLDENIYFFNDWVFFLENLWENIVLGRIIILLCVCYVVLLFEWFILLFYLCYVYVVEKLRIFILIIFCQFGGEFCLVLVVYREIVR